MSSTPSITSEGNAAHALASQRWQAFTSSQQQGDSQPFAALLDATAPTPTATNASAPSPQSSQQITATATTDATAGSPQSGQQTPAPTTDPSDAGQQPAQQAPPPANGSVEISGRNVMASAMPRASADVAATARTGSNSAAKLRAAGGGKWRNAAGSTSEPASDANTGASASTDPNANPNAPAVGANAQASSADALPTNNDPAANDPSQQTGSANPAIAGGALALAAAAAAAAALNLTNGTSGAPKDGASDDNKIGAADPGTATPNGGQPSPNPQPVAAALALNTAFDAAPVTANGQSTSAINEQAKLHARVTPALAGDQNTSAPDAKDPAAAQTAAATQSTADDQSNGNGTSGAATNGNAADPSQSGGAAQQSQAQTQANNSAAALPQSVAAATGAADRVVTRGDGIASTTPSGAAGATNAPSANSVTNVLPNFGFLAANAMTTGAAAAPATSPDAVPLAGLAVAIASRAQAGSNQFDIRLDPPELGRIDVRLDVDRNGQVTSHVTVDRADTLQLLQSHQPQLEQALQQAGLKTADNGLQFTLRDQSFAGQNGGSGGGNGQQHTAQLVIPDAQAAPVDTAQIYSRWNLGSGLDIRV